MGRIKLRTWYQQYIYPYDENKPNVKIVRRWNPLTAGLDEADKIAKDDKKDPSKDVTVIAND